MVKPQRGQRHPELPFAQDQRPEEPIRNGRNDNDRILKEKDNQKEKKRERARARKEKKKESKKERD